MSELTQRPIDENTPRDRPILVTDGYRWLVASFVPASANFHPRGDQYDAWIGFECDSGYIVDEIREPIAWAELPELPPVVTTKRALTL